MTTCLQGSCGAGSEGWHPWLAQVCEHLPIVWAIGRDDGVIHERTRYHIDADPYAKRNSVPERNRVSNAILVQASRVFVAQLPTKELGDGIN